MKCRICKGLADKTYNICKSCNSQRFRDYYAKHPERVKATNARYYAKIGVSSVEHRKTIQRVCLFCEGEFMAEKYNVDRGGALYCSRKCFGLSIATEKTRRKVPGGLSLSRYNYIHVLIAKKLGKPSLCDSCGTTKGTFDWSNKSGSYLEDPSDWQRLCRKCHSEYDKCSEKTQATLLERYGTVSSRKAHKIKESLLE